MSPLAVGPLAGWQVSRWCSMQIVVHRPGAYNGNVLGNLVRRVTKVAGAPLSGCKRGSPSVSRRASPRMPGMGRVFRECAPARPPPSPCPCGGGQGALSESKVPGMCSILLSFLPWRPLGWGCIAFDGGPNTRGSGAETAPTRRNSAVAIP